jgi:hypothetical protein
VVDVAAVYGFVTTRWMLAVPVADLDRSAQGTRERAPFRDRDDGGGAVEQDRLQLGVTEPRDEGAGGDHLAVGQFTHPGEAVIADEHGEHGSGTFAVGGGGRRACRHFHQSGGPPLRTGAHHAIPLIGEIQVALETIQFVGHDRPADGVQHPVHDHHPVKRRRRVEVGPLP